MARCLLLLLLMFSSKAFAVVNNEFFWQAENKELYMYARLYIESIKANFKDYSYAYVRQSGTLSVLGAEYGLNENHSLGIDTSYRKMKVEIYTIEETDYEGLGDIYLHFKGAKVQSNYNLRYGINYTHSLGETVVSNGNQNNHAGQEAITPYIGFDKQFKTYIGGAEFYYSHNIQDRSVDYDGVKYKYTGGDGLGVSFFAERALPKGLKVGTALEYDLWFDQKVKETGDEFDGSDQFYFMIYGSNEYREYLTFTYQLGYLYEKAVGDLASTRGFYGHLGLRYKF